MCTYAYIYQPLMQSVLQGVDRLPHLESCEESTPLTTVPRLYTLHLTPYTLTPASSTLHPTTQTLNPKPNTQNFKPQTLNPTPQELNSRPLSKMPFAGPLHDGRDAFGVHGGNTTLYTLTDLSSTP